MTHVINIYPREKGGIKFELIPTAELNPNTHEWQNEDGGKRYPIQVWDKKTQTLVPFEIPEKVKQPPEWYARMHDCPAKYLKSHKDRRQEWVKPLIIVGVILIDFIWSVMLLGGK